MKETYFEKNLDIFIEDEEKEKTKAVLKDVFSSRLTTDFKGKQATEDIKDAFVKSKLPIYFDALKRGYKIITSQLQTNPKSHSVLNGLGIKNYTFTGEDIYWSITPKSEDPFEQAEFYQAAKISDQQTTGVSSIWTERFLVEQILEEGLNQQDEIFRNFITVLKNILNIEQTMQETSIHLKNPIQNFTDVKNTYIKLKKANKDPDMLRDQFATQYIVPHHPLVSQLDHTLDATRNIEILHNIFKIKQKPLGTNNRKIFEKTITVLLLTEDLHENTNIWDPEANIEKINAVNRFIKKITDSSTKEEIKISLGLILNKTMEHQKIALEKLFQTKGIKPEIGIEFFQSILLQVLKELPEPMFLNNEQNSMNKGDIQSHIRHSYAITDNELGFNFNEDYIHNHVLYGSFPEHSYPTLSPSKQKLYLQAFFKDKLLQERIYLTKNIAHLFKLFRIKYLPQEEKFGNKPSAYFRQTGISTWKKESQEFLMQVFLEQINEGNLCLVDVLREIIFKDSFFPYIQKYDLPTSNTEYSSKVNIVNEQLMKQKLKKDEALEKLVEYTAKYTIACFLTDNIRDDESISSITSGLIRFIHQNLHPNHLFTPGDIGSLEKLISKEVENIISNFKKQSLPEELEQNKLEFIKKTLIKSLQSS